MTDCERKNKWWRGCRFEARYEEMPASMQGLEINGFGDAVSRICRELRSRHYVRDVCIQCGKTIERREHDR